MVKVKLKRKHLELLLEELEDNPSPKVLLEQYPTYNRVAATLLFIAAYVFNDIEGRVVYDFGCGNGRLALGAALLGARRIVGVDVDFNALRVAKRNAEKMGVDDKVEWISMDIKDLKGKADTVVQNPPFGVQRPFSDRIFLEKALEVADVVYSIHKGNIKVRHFIRKFIEERGGRVDQLITVKLPIPAMFDFHSKRFHVVEVDIYRILKLKEKEVSQNER